MLRKSHTLQNENNHHEITGSICQKLKLEDYALSQPRSTTFPEPGKAAVSGLWENSQQRTHTEPGIFLQKASRSLRLLAALLQNPLLIAPLLQVPLIFPPTRHTTPSQMTCPNQACSSTTLKTPYSLYFLESL